MERIRVTETELLRAIEEVLAARAAEDDGAFTTVELAERQGWTEARARRVIRELIAQGRVVPCQAVRLRMDGRPNRVSAYRLVKQEKAQKNRKRA